MSKILINATKFNYHCEVKTSYLNILFILLTNRTIFGS
jgi:hypothetical protein